MLFFFFFSRRLFFVFAKKKLKKYFLPRKPTKKMCLFSISKMCVRNRILQQNLFFESRIIFFFNFLKNSVNKRLEKKSVF